MEPSPLAEDDLKTRRKAPVTTTLLRKYYSNVRTLHEFLLDVLENASGVVLEGDEERYRAMLEDTVIAGPQRVGKPFKAQLPNYDMYEVIVHAQGRILKGISGGARNVLTAGYHLDGGRVVPSRFWKNTSVLVFRSPEWKTLLQRIGVDAVLHLLAEQSIFIPLPNGCLCQVAGDSVVILAPLAKPTSSETAVPLKRKQEEEEACARPYKRRRLAGVQNLGANTTVKSATVSSPADLLFARARLFYSRPCLIPHSNHIVVGLPVNHILNRIYPAYSKPRLTGLYEDPDPHVEAGHVRHLSKYIFPAQYGLDTPLQFVGSQRGAFGYPDYQDREVEIKRLGRVKTPHRLKGILPMIDQVLWRHKKCKYRLLRDSICSSKIPTEDGKKVDSSIILELVSEGSILLQTQPSLRLNDASLDSSGRVVPPFGGTQASAYAYNKPRFVEFACSYTEVFRFVALVTKAVIPMAFWGTKANLHLVLKALKRFITCRRYETISLHYILQGFSTTACEWLMPPGQKAQNMKRVSVSDSLKRRELLEEFMMWYFDGFVIPLLKTTFYITESSAFRNQILYFRQDDWAELCAPLVDRLVGNMFERIPDKDVKEILAQRSLGFSFVRLLPKETGVRPIVNLRKKKILTTGSYTAERSINQVLQTAFNVLTYEKTVHAERLGASVFGSDEVYTKLKDFKGRLSKRGSESAAAPRLYFVKVDVQACFDSIDQTKLLEILRQLLTEKEYVSQRYGQLNLSANRIKRSFQRKAVPKGHGTHFLKTAQDLAGALRNVIFVDQVKYPTETREAIVALLEEHITENMVKIGGHYYRQKVGIPQGSILSALLCSFFYGDLESRVMNFTQDSESVLMRLIDDYLLITTSLPKARQFLTMMNKGHPEYGCFISREKTLTNFDHDAEVMNIVDPLSKSFPWCGYLINMRDLSVTVDYSRYASWGMKNTLTVDRGRRLGAAFNHKMVLAAQARNHVLFSDPKLNSEDTIYLNIYQNFLLAALKMQEYIREGGLLLRHNSVYVYKTIQQSIEGCHISIMAQAARKLQIGRPSPALKATTVHSLALQKRWHLNRMAVFWLGNHAFHRILSKKPHGYAVILRNLEKQLTRLGNGHFKRRFKRVVKEGRAAFDYNATQ